MFEDHNESVLDAFRFITQTYKVRIIFTTRLIETKYPQPKLADFVWNRKIISYCTQIIAVAEDKFVDILESDLNKIKKNVWLLSLKNKNCLDEKILFKIPI